MIFAETVRSSQMFSPDRAFLKDVFDKLKGFLQDGVHILDQIDLATAEGKALDQLRERIIGSHIDAEICLADASSMLDKNKHELAVSVVTLEPLPLEVKFHIYQLLAAANLRYAITIRAEFLKREKQRFAQG
jgi:hypothetical protein